MPAARCAWEVRGGVIPGASIPALTRQWFYTSEEFEQDRNALRAEIAAGLDPNRADAPQTFFQKYKKEAVDYYDSINDPTNYNWAEIKWIWY